MKHNICLENSYSRSRFILIITGALLVFIKGIETLGSSLPHIGWLYHHLFYKKMLQKEIEQADLKSSINVLHIGCGPLPLTAYELAKRGFSVEAVDNDPHVIEKARKFISSHACKELVKVKEADGMNVDLNSAEAVWISLHVSPRDKVIARTLSALKKGGKLVYRNPRGWLSILYPRVEPMEGQGRYSYQIFKQLLGKETVVITKL